jgi:hypothetical protein
LPESIKQAMLAEVNGDNGLLAQVKAIAARLESIRGTAAERRNQAVATLREAETTEVHKRDSVDPDNPEREVDSDLPFTYVDYLTTEIERLTAERDEVKQQCDAAVSAWLKAKHDDTTSEAEALKEQAKALTASIANIAQLTGHEFDVPALPKGSRSGSTGGSKVTSKTGRHYHVVDGKREYYAKDSFSGLAWYAFSKVGVDALTAALKAQGIHMLGDPWEATLTLNGKTVTVGHEIVSAE